MILTKEKLLRWRELALVKKIDTILVQEQEMVALCDAALLLERADRIILTLTMDHNSTPNYVRGFEMAREYMADWNEMNNGATSKVDGGTSHG